ncbi:hypothetical protein C8R44DRAFT_746389 [Mycena epipterygia]|nr:hypothetical protein C8R44DRAFT_746389 [Mycena epipterygia]
MFIRIGTSPAFPHDLSPRRRSRKAEGIPAPEFHLHEAWRRTSRVRWGTAADAAHAESAGGDTEEGGRGDDGGVGDEKELQSTPAVVRVVSLVRAGVVSSAGRGPGWGWYSGGATWESPQSRNSSRMRVAALVTAYIVRGVVLLRMVGWRMSYATLEQRGDQQRAQRWEAVHG